MTESTISAFFAPKMTTRSSSRGLSMADIPKPVRKPRKAKSSATELVGPQLEAEPSLDFLAKKNAHPRDAFIEFFEEGHKYKVYGEFGKYDSVTTLVHHSGWFKEFDEEKTIESIIRKGYPTLEGHKYFGMTADQIRESWNKNKEDASSKGTLLHLNIEKYYNGVPVSDDTLEYGYFMNFVKDHPHLEPYRTEWSIFHDEARISGQIDILFFNRNTGEFEIGDWKRTKDLSYFCTFGKDKGIPQCLQDLDNVNFTHYSLQLSIYKWILAEKYNIRVSKLFLIVLHPNQSNYVIHDIPDIDEYQERIAILMKERMDRLTQKNINTNK
jgi:hypothetical protein